MVIISNHLNNIENKKREIDKYKSTWDSDDNDQELQQYYNHIVNNEPSIHAEKLQLQIK